MTEIWLPRKEIQQQAGILTFITWSDVTGSRMGLDELRMLISSMCTEALMNLISTISIIQTNTPRWDLSFIHSQQCNLARNICTPEIAGKVERLITTGRRDVLAHEEQLLLGARLALLYGQPGPAEIPAENALGKLGEFLLGVSEVLQSGEDISPAPDELMVSLVLRRQANSRNEQLRYCLARYFDLLVMRTCRVSQPECDLDKAFLEKIGLAIEEYMALAFMYLSPFYNVTEVMQLQAMGFHDVIKRYEEQIRTPELREQCRQLFSQDASGFRADLQADACDTARYSFLPFKRKPLFRTVNGSAIPISLPFLIETVAMGAYWHLLDYYSAIGGRKGVQTFAGYMGKLFQPYVTELLERTYTGAGCGDQHFYGEQEIIASSPKAPQGEHPPFDGILISEKSIVIFEMGVMSLTATIMEQADPAHYIESLKRDFVRKIEKQLNRAFQGIAEGIWSAPGLDRSKILHVYPVLALLHPFPQAVATWKPLWEVALPRGWYRCGGEVLMTQVYEPQILVAEELEMLEPRLHEDELRLPALLQRKLSNSTTAGISMKNYLLNYLQVKERPNDHMLVLFKTATDRLIASLSALLNLAPK